MGMASRGAEYCVIECPSFYLAQTHLQYIEFTLAVFTNLDDETVDNRHESFEGYKAAKGKLFQVQYGLGGCWGMHTICSTGNNVIPVTTHEAC